MSDTTVIAPVADAAAGFPWLALALACLAIAVAGYSSAWACAWAASRWPMPPRQQEGE